MIVNHKAGELTSGLMSRQYRSAFNGAAGVVAVAGSQALGWPVDHIFLWAWPAGVAAAAYLVNLRGRLNRVRPYELQKPTKHTEDEILELQDIHFNMPREHQHLTDELLKGAYEQISRGNIDAVQIRLQRGRALKDSILAGNIKSDTMEDVKHVEAAARAMTRAIEA